MYIMRKMNWEKKAATDAERAALLADGYRDVTPPALHEDASVETESSVKPGKVPAGRNQDKAQVPIKKLKAADTRQKKTMAASGLSAQSAAETEKSEVSETTEVSESIQKESVSGAAAHETQQSAEAVGSTQDQSPGTS